MVTLDLVKTCLLVDTLPVQLEGVDVVGRLNVDPVLVVGALASSNGSQLLGALLVHDHFAGILELGSDLCSHKVS